MVLYEHPIDLAPSFPPLWKAAPVLAVPGAARTQQILGSAPLEEHFVLNTWIRALGGQLLCPGVVTVLWKDDCIGVTFIL